MKHFLVLTILTIAILLFSDLTFANPQSSVPTIKFASAKYTLRYSAKDPETKGYLNEYYKANQTYTSWTDLIGVHHYPTAFYPIEHAKEFNKYLNDSGILSSIEIDDVNNSALVYFVITNNDKLPIIMEFNVFKYIKSPICGSIGIQYAKRYLLNSPLEIERTKKLIVKSGMKYIKHLNKLDVPNVVTINADNGNYILKEGFQNHLENLE